MRRLANIYGGAQAYDVALPRRGECLGHALARNVTAGPPNGTLRRSACRLCAADAIAWIGSLS